jgi:predicted DNA-binding protein (UPF0251 family)
MPAQVAVEPGYSLILTLDQLEALRLADLMGLYHEEAAEEMGISRATFGRIVEEARRKIADALVNGKALLIEGGNTEMKEEHEMPQRDGTGPVGEGKGRGLGPCGCGQRRGHGPHRAAGPFRHGGMGKAVSDDQSAQEHEGENTVNEDQKERKK